MPVLVMKFGGTSVGTVDRILKVAGIVKENIDLGYTVIVVVSAMSGETQRLIDLCDSFGSLQYDYPEEYSVVVSSGEQVASGCLAIALKNLGVKCRSWLGWQIPILTSDYGVKPRISSIDVSDIFASINDGEHAIVSGYQCIHDKSKRVLTLGRGGSDTSAAAMAAAIGAEFCDVYKDVEGIYTADPRIVSNARKLSKIAYEEMLELSSLGSKVLHTRSVGLAMKYGVILRVLSSFENKPGTIVCREDQIVEGNEVTGITCSYDETRITILGVVDTPGVAASLFGCLSEANINIDMIFQDVSKDGKTSITFTTSKSESFSARNIIDHKKMPIEYDSCIVDDDIAKVSVVGIGMRNHAGIASQVFKALAKENINIKAITTSEIRVSILISSKYMELAVRTLHDAFNLEEA